MSNGKYTPGPWKIVLGTIKGFNDDGEWLFISPSTAKVGDCGPAICVISHRNEANSTDTANARLVAAAPEMLAALIVNLKKYEDTFILNRELFDIIHEHEIRAIESATGESIEEVLG